MLDTVGHSVRRLTRVRFGVVELGDLAPGHWRQLDEEERTKLRALAGVR
jgi:23S rRNA pseudouridine2605 synthase